MRSRRRTHHSPVAWSGSDEEFQSQSPRPAWDAAWDGVRAERKQVGLPNTYSVTAVLHSVTAVLHSVTAVLPSVTAVLPGRSGDPRRTKQIATKAAGIRGRSRPTLQHASLHVPRGSAREVGRR